MREATLEHAAGNVHYWTNGSQRDCIVFTHGATMDHGLFDGQLDAFQADWKLITWDVPAHGRSRPYENFSLEDATDQLASILDAEGVDSAHLVGQSMGGYISQLFASRYPERVRSVTAVGSSPLSNAYFSRLDLWLLSITPGLLKFFPTGYLRKTIADQVTATQSSRDYAYETLQTYSKAEIAQIMKAVYEAVVSFGPEAPKPPAVLITHGDQERTGKVAAYSARWSAEEGWPLEVIEGAAHNCNMDNPKAFNAVLEKFIRAL